MRVELGSVFDLSMVDDTHILCFIEPQLRVSFDEKDIFLMLRFGTVIFRSTYISLCPD